MRDRLRVRARVRAGVREGVRVRTYACMIYHIGLSNMIEPS